MNYFKRLIVFLVLPAAMLLSGCEGSKDDATGNEAYFKNNPYSSDDRPDILPATLVISPEVIAIDLVGQEVVFTVKGGEGDYHWTVSSREFGEVYSRGANQCIYICRKVGNNDVIATDDAGHFASAHVSSSAEAMSITPAAATLSGTARYVAFTVSGGTAPYTWTSGNASLGTISYSASSSYTAAYTANAGAYGINTITVRDAAGRTASASVTQNE